MELTNLDLVRHIHRLFNTRRPDQAKEFEEVLNSSLTGKGMTVDTPSTPAG